MAEPSWTYQELQAELREFERQLKAAGLKPNSIQTVNGHRELPVDGRETSPLVDSRTPQLRT